MSGDAFDKLIDTHRKALSAALMQLFEASARKKLQKSARRAP